jgi:hypothetical protein
VLDAASSLLVKWLGASPHTLPFRLSLRRAGVAAIKRLLLVLKTEPVISIEPLL